MQENVYALTCGLARWSGPSAKHQFGPGSLLKQILGYLLTRA